MSNNKVRSHEKAVLLLCLHLLYEYNYVESRHGRSGSSRYIHTRTLIFSHSSSTLSVSPTGLLSETCHRHKLSQTDAKDTVKITTCQHMSGDAIMTACKSDLFRSWKRSQLWREVLER